MNTNIKQILVSVIIPVYNGEAFIKDSIQSVIDQDYQNWKLIIVNDGSTDRTNELCKYFSEKDNRILLINKENNGVSSARNVAISQVNEGYVLFLDADDKLQPNTLSECISEISQEDTLIQFSYSKIDENDQNLSMNELNEGFYHSIVDYHESGNYPYTVWGFFIPYRLIQTQSLRFDETLHYGEDQEFIIQILLEAENIKVISSPLYLYRQHSNSAMSGSKNFIQAKQHLQLADKIVEKNYKPSYSQKFIERRLISFMRRYFIISSFIDNKEISIKDIVLTLKQSDIYTLRSQFSSISLKFMLSFPLLTLVLITYSRNFLESIGSKYAKKLS